MVLLKVSNSRINLFRNCHYAHYLKYIKGLEKRKKGMALRRGSIIHECIEAYNSGKSWKKPFKVFEKDFYDNTFMEERLEVGDIPKMVSELLENYFHYYEDEELEYIQNELHFQLPLTSDIEIEGYIDAVVKDGRNKTWPMETKTYTKSPDRDMLMFNNQSAIYTWALSELGYKPEGTLWNIIRAKEPSRPRMTDKTGKLSLAKLDSTPYTANKAIREMGLDPRDYQEFIEKLSYDSYLFRHYIRINKDVVSTIMGDTIYTATNILDKGDKIKDRNLTRNCGWCSFKEICQAELMGLDTDFIIKHEYQLREKGGEKIEKKQKNESRKSR